MERMKLHLVLLLLVVSPGVLATRNLPSHLYPVHNLLPTQDNVAVVDGLLKRLIPDQAALFDLVIDPNLGPIHKDTFQLKSVDSQMEIRGTSSIALSLGINHYLKYYCHAHVSWSGDQLDLPDPLPKIDTPVKVTTNDRFRYYQNVCTVSYSMVWWDWKRWEREIDWMALNGINMPLAFNAQETIWFRVYKKMGFTDDDINQYFTGPAFLAWNRMGNFQGFAGPLSQSWHQKQLTLQHQILDRMREFGMLPILPAFAGRVPPAFPKLFPGSNVVNQTGNWGGFDHPYCCTSFLSPQDPLFITVGSLFIQEYIEEFGTDHLYNTDLFNEMSPPTSDPDYLTASGRAVFESLTVVDPKAVWVMQGWLFVNSPSFWQPEQTKALVTSVPQGRMIILDLEAEYFPQYSRFESFYGQPFIWCIIQNFGGVLGHYGSFESINNGTFTARKFPNSTMIGTGLAPEGIEKNDVIYEFTNEMAWRTQPVDLDEWVSDYATRRYGLKDDDLTQAWKLLKGSVYAANSTYINHGTYVMVSRPSLGRTPLVWYDPQDVVAALDLFNSAGENNPELTERETYKYDLVDLSRQVLQLSFDYWYVKAANYFQLKDLIGLKNASDALLKTLDDLELILSTDKHFLLGTWVAGAKSMASTLEEELLFEYNARNQISLWGPTGQILDYSNKQWSGVVSGYYRPRWELFLTTLTDCLTKGTPYNQGNFNKRCLWFSEEPFTYRFDALATQPKGDPFEVVNQIIPEHRSVLNSLSVATLTKLPSRRRSKLQKKARKAKIGREWVAHRVPTKEPELFS